MVIEFHDHMGLFQQQYNVSMMCNYITCADFHLSQITDRWLFLYISHGVAWQWALWNYVVRSQWFWHDFLTSTRSWSWSSTKLWIQKDRKINTAFVQWEQQMWGFVENGRAFDDGMDPSRGKVCVCKVGWAQMQSKWGRKGLVLRERVRLQWSCYQKLKRLHSLQKERSC